MIATLRTLRESFTESGNIAWRADAITILKARGFDAVSLIKKLKSQPASKLLTPVR